MRVHIDDERCEGHGRCYALAPTVFEPDEIGAAVHGAEAAVRVGSIGASTSVGV